jgi:hypothetical protein
MACMPMYSGAYSVKHGRGEDAKLTTVHAIAYVLIGCNTSSLTTLSRISALNQFFRWYYGEHGQGGTKTKQRNLRHLSAWLEAEYDNPHPYTDDLLLTDFDPRVARSRRSRYDWRGRTRPTPGGTCRTSCWRMPLAG